MTYTVSKVAERYSVDVHSVLAWISLRVSISGAIGNWYRTLVREFHPDLRHGSHIGMLAINRARDLLIQLTGARE
jgi:hypothetical protein